MNNYYLNNVKEFKGRDTDYTAFYFTLDDEHYEVVRRDGENWVVLNEDEDTVSTVSTDFLTARYAELMQDRINDLEAMMDGLNKQVKASGKSEDFDAVFEFNANYGFEQNDGEFYDPHSLTLNISKHTAYMVIEALGTQLRFSFNDDDLHLKFKGLMGQYESETSA